MQRNKVLSYLGLATRAGRVVSGEFCVEKSVRQRRARLVLVSEDASENSRKNFRNLCTYYKVSAAIEDEGLAMAAVRELKQRSGIGGGKYVE